MTTNYVIGIDYGTDSVRALLVNADDGTEVCSDVFYYPRWKEGKYCNPSSNQFRQHPLDYIEGLKSTIKNCINQISEEMRSNIKAISIDTTGSTPCFTDKMGKPLSLLPGFENNPNAMFILWKDHTAIEEAELINETAKSWGGVDYTKYEGGVYSSEWFWSKILHIITVDNEIRDVAYSVLELCDWIPALLCGIQDVHKIKRSRCAAGHKAMWHESWNGLPSEKFLQLLDPLLSDYRKKLYSKTYTLDKTMGVISTEWAEQLNIPSTTKIGIGAFDAHMGAIGAGIEAYSLVKIMGTSTCDVLVAPKSEVQDKLIKGICGQVDGSVIPEMIGMEAGQSSFGDVFAWFKSILMWPLKRLELSTNSQKSAEIQHLYKKIDEKILEDLEKEAMKIDPEKSNISALDWLNGRRTPYANQKLKAAITGLDLGTGAPSIYRALVEATAFGAKKINDCFESQGVPIKSIIGIGGIPKKSNFIMQIMADVLNRPIKVCNSNQACALGAAMCAATAAGIYPTVAEAQMHMNSGFSKEFLPIPENIEIYKNKFANYEYLGDFIDK